MDREYVVLFGNLHEGFGVIGPFRSLEKAEEYARGQERYGGRYDRWFVTELQDPDK